MQHAPDGTVYSRYISNMNMNSMLDLLWVASVRRLLLFVTCSVCMAQCTSGR